MEERLLRLGRVDTVFQNMAWPEDQHSPRLNGNLLPGFGVAAHPPALGPDGEGPERGQLDGLTTCQAFRDFVEHALDERSGIISGQADLGMQRLAEMCAGDGCIAHPVRPSDFRIKRRSRSEERLAAPEKPVNINAITQKRWPREGTSVKHPDHSLRFC